MMEMAEQMLTEGAAADVAETFAAILAEEPENAAAYGGLIRAHLAVGDLDKAQGFADAAPAKIAGSPEVSAAKAQIELARQAANAGPEQELRAALARDPGNPQVMFDLATALQAAGDVQGAVDLLLDLFKLDVGRYPNDAEGLRALVERPATAQGWTGPYLKKGLPTDPWGAAYLYKNPGRNGGPDVFSLGADGKPGGDGENADVYN